MVPAVTVISVGAKYGQPGAGGHLLAVSIFISRVIAPSGAPVAGTVVAWSAHVGNTDAVAITGDGVVAGVGVSVVPTVGVGRFGARDGVGVGEAAEQAATTRAAARKRAC